MSVLRRVHTNNFTIIGNACLCDETLSAEALGVICYLIGRPHNWVLQPGQLSDRFCCGRDRIQRILRELIDAGYIRRIQQRDELTNSFLGVEYIVLDTKDEPLPENTVAAPSAENPEPENPEPGNQALQRTDSKKTESNKTPKRKPAGKRKVIAYSTEFENEVWQPYPFKNGTSKANAFRKWEVLSPEDQLMVKTTIPIYTRMKDREKFSHHLEFYISRRIFETVGLVSAPAGAAPAAELDRQTWENLSRIYASSSNWRSDWGPEPGHPACRMPADLQKQFVNQGVAH